VAAVLLASAVTVWSRLPFPGALFVFVVGGYGVGRLGLESLRELPAGGHRFTIHHAVSLLLVLSSLAALAAGWSK
jgi:prolipoprotein diacylglyceryltransferase